MKKPTKKELTELRRWFEIFESCPFEIGLDSPMPHMTCNNENPTKEELCKQCWQQAIEKAEGEL